MVTPSPPGLSKVLIFGATGEVASAAALEARARGASVTLAMRDVSKTNEWISPKEERAAGLQRITASLDDAEAVSRAVQATGAEAAFIYAVQTPDSMRSVLAALRDTASIRHVVFLSTSQLLHAGAVTDDIRSVTRDHVIPWQHAQVEIALQDLGVPHTALRPGFFASNPLRIYLDKATKSEVNLLAPEVRHDPIDPADIGRAAAALLVNPPRGGDGPRRDIVYLNGPALLSQDEQWAIINRELATAGKLLVKVNYVTAEKYLANLAGMGVPDMVARSLCKSMVHTRTLYTAQDHEAAKGTVEMITGRKPTSFEDFVRREIPRYFD
ncbi:hypothetical protein GGS24DRAFT_511320 [Hypoxylon argillaceum]|nr:hypothetical protein GGS24DRAFT_511320 [Hypoxylon argillaceum]KAI1152851.1 hypothetical protein F4825DRAFT_298811 [Nemania diffusa]